MEDGTAPPPSVQRAVWLLYFAFAIDALPRLLALVSAPPPAAPGVNIWVIYAPAAVIYGGNLALIVMIHRRQDWARHAYAVVAAFGCWITVRLLFRPGQIGATGVFMGLAGLASVGVQVLAMILLFGKQAADWFYLPPVDERRNGGGFPASASGFAASARRLAPVRQAGPSDQEVAAAHSRWRVPVIAVNVLLILLTLGSVPFVGLTLIFLGLGVIFTQVGDSGVDKLLLCLCAYGLYLGAVFAAILKWRRAAYLHNITRATFMLGLAPLPLFLILFYVLRRAYHP